MGGKITILNGATRAEGNTDFLVGEFSRGLLKAEIDLTRFTLRDLKIADCIGCCTCLRESVCHFSDDMTSIRQRMVESELIVFASPLYWCEVTGLMKKFIDRLYYFHHKVNRPLLEGKEAIVITTLGEERVDGETAIIREFYSRLLGSLRISILEMLFFPGLMEQESVQQRKDYLEKAYNTGIVFGLRTSGETRLS